MPQENIARRETQSGVRRSWIVRTIHRLSKASGVSLSRNRMAMLSSSDTSYAKKAGETSHRLNGSRPVGRKGGPPRMATGRPWRGWPGGQRRARPAARPVCAYGAVGRCRYAGGATGGMPERPMATPTRDGRWGIGTRARTGGTRRHRRSRDPGRRGVGRPAEAAIRRL